MKFINHKDIEFGNNSISFKYSQLNTQEIDIVKITFYNDIDAMKTLFAMDVEGLITDYPDLATRLIIFMKKRIKPLNI